MEGLIPVLFLALVIYVGVKAHRALNNLANMNKKEDKDNN